MQKMIAAQCMRPGAGLKLQEERLMQGLQQRGEQVRIQLHAYVQPCQEAKDLSGG